MDLLVQRRNLHVLAGAARKKNLYHEGVDLGLPGCPENSPDTTKMSSSAVQARHRSAQISLEGTATGLQGS
jgi:hypothetical protein